MCDVCMCVEFTSSSNEPKRLQQRNDSGICVMLFELWIKQSNDTSLKRKNIDTKPELKLREMTDACVALRVAEVDAADVDLIETAAHRCCTEFFLA